MKSLLTFFITLMVASQLFAYTPSNPNGGALGSASSPVVLSAPNYYSATVFTSPHASSAYTAGQTVANSATAGSVTPVAFVMAPANGVPVWLLKCKLLTQTSGSAGQTLTNASWILHIYGQLPTVSAGDGVAFSTTMVNWCGDMVGVSSYLGTDYSVSELVPERGSTFPCTPGGSSQTIYGLLEVNAAFTPSTSNSTYTLSCSAQ
jgi:hypothetical protein